jgi:hypothetical protein
MSAAIRKRDRKRTDEYCAFQPVGFSVSHNIAHDLDYGTVRDASRDTYEVNIPEIYRTCARIMNITRTIKRPWKLTTDSNGSKRSGRGFSNIQPRMTMKLCKRNGIRIAWPFHNDFTNGITKRAVCWVVCLVVSFYLTQSQPVNSQSLSPQRR